MSNFTQDRFTAGELDPRLYYRVGWDGYAKAAKGIRNGLVIPQGGIQRRFGTRFVTNITALVTNLDPANYEMYAFTYNSDTVYLLVFTPLAISIYLQGSLQDTVVTTYTAEDIKNIRATQIQNRLQIVCGRIIPRLLSRGAGSSYNITSVDTANDYIITDWGSGIIGAVYPVVFGGGAVPAGVPQIVAGQTYYVRVFSTTTAAMRIYASADDAGNNVNWFELSTAGTTATVTLQNNFSIANMVYKFLPSYDFANNYDALTFTVSGGTGSITLTASSALFTAEYVGGLFSGGSGIMRITGYTSTTAVTGYTLQDFVTLTGIRGDLSFLGEPAWSDTKGWPRACSFYQNRSVLGNTLSLSNGAWLSAINDISDFDDSFPDDDYAISYYPAAGDSSYIIGFTSARSLLVHTNTGSYSTPLNDTALTPRSITFTQQNKDGVSSIVPIFLDNQILYVDKSVNNVKSMIWEISQSSYVLNNASIVSSHLIQSPIDMIGYSNPKFADGSYVFVVNADGTLATMQTLIEQNIQAWSLLNTDSSYERSLFNKVTSSLDHLWFGVQRSLLKPSLNGEINITAYSSVNNTLTVSGGTYDFSNIQAAVFGSSGTLPSTTPPLTTQQYYFTRGFSGTNTFKVYTSHGDALNEVNPLIIHNAGTSAQIEQYFAVNQFLVEELDFTVYTDCTKIYENVNSNTLTGLDYIEGEVVQIVGDSVVYPEQTVFNGQLTLPATVQNAYVGLQYRPEFKLLPVNTLGPSGNTIYTPTHIRQMYLNFYKTIEPMVKIVDASVSSTAFNVPLDGTQDLILGQAPQPRNFVTPTIGVMGGWDNTGDITVTQQNPYPMTLLGVSYEVTT